MTYSPINSQTAFLNTSIVFSDDESQRIYELTKLVTDLANYINIREISQFVTLEVLNGQQFTDPANTSLNKFVYRQLYYIGQVNAGATLNVAHGINTIVQFTHIYGTVVTAIPDYRPIPRVSTVNVNQQISLDVGPVNFTIINGSAAPQITRGIVVLEYLKN